MKVKIVNHSNNKLPEYKTEESAGMDLRAWLDAPVTLGSLERALVPTGLYMEIPKGCEGQLRARSGLAVKHGIALVNGVGTIDSDYRGEIKVAVVNLSREPFTITSWDRIAQVIISRHESVELVVVSSINETERGAGGFGSTGI